MKRIEGVLLGLHSFVGIGAFTAGLMTMLNPEEPLGVSTELLKNAPFDDFMIPGILLFAVIGIGHLVSAVCIGIKYKYRGYTSGVSGGALVIWIVVQCIMLLTVGFLHVLFFFIGAVEGILATLILFRDHLYPSDIIRQIIKKYI